MDQQHSLVDIKIKSEDVEQVRVFLETLELQKTLNNNFKNTEFKHISDSPPSKSTQAEIKEIKDYRVGLNGWEFLICWNDGVSSDEWVLDCDTDCEISINNFLHTKGIYTCYCVCRVSTKEQACDTKTSLYAQESELRAVAPSNNRIKIVKIAASAYKNIPNTLKMIGEAAGCGDSIYIYRIDRLSRNIIKYLDWLETLNTRGITIYSCTENIKYSDHKLDFIQAILNAQKESALLGSRIRMSNKRRRDRGDEQIGGLKYGYKYHREKDGHLTVIKNMTEMAIINKIHSYSNIAPAVIAQDLNKAKLYKKNRRWSTAMVERVLKNL